MTNWGVLNCKLLNANHFLGYTLPAYTVISNIYVIGNLFDHADTYDGGGGGNNPGIFSKGWARATAMSNK
jgi:hypothetical protein